MGDEILMKKLIILPFLAIYLQASDDRFALVQEYQQMFSKIGEKRQGVDPRKIDAINIPFVTVEKEVKTEEGKVILPKPKEELSLQALVNNRAKISGQWYGIGDEIQDLKVVSIENGAVWLQNRDYKKRLSMRKENAKISIQ